MNARCGKTNATMSITATAVENRTVTYFAAFLLFAAVVGAYLQLGQLGLCHSLWLTDAGALFAAGLNDVGQCGVGSPSTLAAPASRLSIEPARLTVSATSSLPSRSSIEEVYR